MIKKTIYALISLSILLVCPIIAIRIRDYSQLQELRNKAEQINIGMTEKEVVNILGKPTNIWTADSPSRFWCYETDSIAMYFVEQPEIHCGSMVLVMSSEKNGTVTSVLKF